MIKLFLDTTTAKKAKVKITKESIVIENENESPLVSIREALAKGKLELSDIAEFSANPGPGSYTGIRIGLAVTNALNFALGNEFEPIDPIYG